MFCLCVLMGIMHVPLCLQRSEEGLRFPGTGIVDAMWVLGIKPGFSGRATSA